MSYLFSMAVHDLYVPADKFEMSMRESPSEWLVSVFDEQSTTQIFFVTCTSEAANTDYYSIVSLFLCYS